MDTRIYKDLKIVENKLYFKSQVLFDMQSESNAQESLVKLKKHLFSSVKKYLKECKSFTIVKSPSIVDIDMICENQYDGRYKQKLSLLHYKNTVQWL